jgi:hypothetical protein
MDPSGNLSFTKRSNVWDLNPEGWNRFFRRPLGLGGHFGWEPAWLEEAGRAFFNYICPGISLQLSKIVENVSHRNRLALGNNSCIELAAFLGASSTDLLSISPRLPVGDFCQPLVVTSASGCRTKGFPASAVVDPKFSVSVLCGQRRMESPDPREFAYQVR